MGSTDRQGGRETSRDRRSVPQVATPVYATQAALAAAVTDAGNALAALTTSVSDSLAGKAPAAHTHAQADITGLVAALAGKAATSHSHSATEIPVDTDGMVILRGANLQEVLQSIDDFLAGL